MNTKQTKKENKNTEQQNEFLHTGELTPYNLKQWQLVLLVQQVCHLSYEKITQTNFKWEINKMLQAPVNSYLENRSRHRGKEGELLKIPNLINKIIFIAQKKNPNYEYKASYTYAVFCFTSHIYCAQETPLTNAEE